MGYKYFYLKGERDEAKMVCPWRFGSGILLALPCLSIPCPKITEDSHPRLQQ